MMDIVELSLKMEANLLAGYSSQSKFQKPNESFSQRLTRSQTMKRQKPLIEENEAIEHSRKPQTKVEVEKIYLDKKAKVVHKNLETIYEDPIWKKGSTMLLGSSKVKRSIYLDREFRITSKQKSKLRKMKIKRLGKRIKPFKISDEEFNSKMLKIDNYLNSSDQDVDCGKEHIDAEFSNCETHQDCNDMGNVQTRNNNSSESSKNFDMGSEFLIQ